MSRGAVIGLYLGLVIVWSSTWVAVRLAQRSPSAILRTGSGSDTLPGSATSSSRTDGTTASLPDGTSRRPLHEGQIDQSFRVARMPDGKLATRKAHDGMWVIEEVSDIGHDREKGFVQARDEMLTLLAATETKEATPAREATGRLQIATFEC